MWVCIHIFVCIGVCDCGYMYIYICVSVCIFLCVYSCVYVSICVCLKAKGMCFCLPALLPLGLLSFPVSFLFFLHRTLFVGMPEVQGFYTLSYPTHTLANLRAHVPQPDVAFCMCS